MRGRDGVGRSGVIVRRAVVALLAAVLLHGGCGRDPVMRAGDPTCRIIDTEPDWSPDGKTIAYAHYTYQLGGFYQIWLLDLQTMQKRFLTHGLGLPAWSPDGTKIAFVKDNDIHVIDVETEEMTRLTFWGACYFPSWSPDGARIAFDTSHGDPAGASAIWIMDADGSNEADISEHGTGEWRMPAWSPDGSLLLHIRYVAGGGPAPDLFRMDTDGRHPVRLTDDSRDDRYPSWSPDGTKIAWSSSRDGLRNPADGIWVMNADGGGERQVVWDGNKGGRPSWSPDGTRIVYPGYNEDSDTVTLWVVNVDGTHPHPLTTPGDYE